MINRREFGARLGRRQFARNVGFVLAGRVWYVLAWFLATPLILTFLGPERFGVWSFLFLISGYLATADLGMASAVTKFGAELSADGNWNALRSIVAGIHVTFLALSLLWAIAAIVGAEWMVDWLGVSDQYTDEVRNSLIAATLILSVGSILSTGPGLLNGMQRMDLSNIILIAASVPQFLVLLIGLAQGFGLYAAVASTAVYVLVTTIGSWIALSRVAPALGWPLVLGASPTYNWFRFSIAMQVNNLIALFHLQSDKIVLTSLLGVAAVTSFELAFRVANGGFSLFTLALSPLLPLLARTHGLGQSERFASIVRRGTAAVAWLSTGLVALLLPSGGLLIRAWVGEGHGTAESLVPWLSSGMGLSLLTGVATAGARAIGRPGLETGPAIAALAVHLAASFFLVQRLGPIGVGPAFALGSATYSGLFFLLFLRTATRGSSHLLRGFLLRIVVAAVIAACLGYLGRWFVETSLSPGRSASAIGFLLIAGLSGGTYLLLTWRSDSAQELRSMARTALSRAREDSVD